MLKTAVHLTSCHSAIDPRIFDRECRSLVAAGYRVSLIAPAERSQVKAGVHIRVIPRARSRAERLLMSGIRIFFAALRENADIYHFHDPDLLWVGLLLRLMGKRVVYDVHEDLSRQFLNKPWIPRRFRRAAAWGIGGVELACARFWSAIIAATPWIGARFPGETTVIVRNFPPRSALAEDYPPYLDRPMRICYAGALSRSRGLFEMLDIADCVGQRFGASLTLAGSFVSADERAAAERSPGWLRTEYQGRISNIEALSMIAASRVGLLLLSPTAAYLQSYPLKLFEYMARGIPFVASDFACWREIVGRFGCCIFVPSDASRAAIEAVTWLLENPRHAEEMGRRGREAVVRYFNWDAEVRILTEVYRRLAPTATADVLRTEAL